MDSSSGLPKLKGDGRYYLKGIKGIKGIALKAIFVSSDRSS